MTSDLSDAVLSQFGLRGAAVEVLSGGTINRVWRIDDGSERYVLKQYTRDTSVEQVRQGIRVLNVAGARGLPVPAVFPDCDGDVVCEAPEGVFVLSEYVAGRLYEPGELPAEAARDMGETLGKLHDALAALPPGRAQPLPPREAIEEQLRALLAIAQTRLDDRVDEIAAGVLEAKLDLLATIERVPEFAAQWTHGDYEWRNVLFGEDDRVAAVIDFDDAQYFSPARDVMRCIALSFPSLAPEVDDYFAGYASVRRLSAADTRAYVEFYRYISTQRVWPIRARYLSPESYQPRWDELIQPILPWDWQALADRLAGVAADSG